MDTRIYVVAEESPRIAELTSVLKITFKCEVLSAACIAHVARLVDQAPRHQGLVLLDYAADDEMFWKDLQSRQSLVKVAVIDAPESEQIAFSALQRGVSGLFTAGTPIEVLLRGLRSVLQGELWFRRSILSRFAQGLQAGANPYDAETSLVHRLGLSKREADVLLMMKEGANNQAIAEALFISEHTVKSHISRILRKSNTRNRSEAVYWMQCNL